LVAIGDILQFNFEDAEDFILYNVGAKLYSPNQALTNPLSPSYNPNKKLPGCLNKTVNACFSASLDQDALAKDTIALKNIEIADKYNQSIGSIRKATRDAKNALIKADIAQSIASLFK
jgi:hypothetical protein